MQPIRTACINRTATVLHNATDEYCIEQLEAAGNNYNNWSYQSVQRKKKKKEKKKKKRRVWCKERVGEGVLEGVVVVNSLYLFEFSMTGSQHLDAE